MLGNFTNASHRSIVVWNERTIHNCSRYEASVIGADICKHQDITTAIKDMK
jgi:hypothetical protein